jgi:hypothetical protein
MSIEAMKQALEHVQEFKRRWFAVPPFGNKVNKATRDAVTLTHVPVFQIEDTLRQAIAEAEKQERYFCERCGKRLSGGIHTCTPPVEAEKQEPVAWIEHHKGGDNLEWQNPGGKCSPLYTHPPKREWVGLTDEEMHECWDSHLTPLGMKHARMIEAKLKQKNGYAEEKNT